MPEPASADPDKPAGERLQRVLAARGVASRRQAEALIRAGRVTVNGRKVTEMGTRVSPESATIRVDGKVIRPKPNRYLMLNKPTGFITSMHDERGRRTVMELVPTEPRVFPVGRLDRDTEGLLLFTNDGDLANRVAHPRYGLAKEYTVVTPTKPSEATMRQVRSGINIDGKLVVPHTFRVVRETPESVQLSIVVHEGMNRIVRRMMEAVGIEVTHLRRERIGPLSIAGVDRGSFRELTNGELASLREALHLEFLSTGANGEPRTPSARQKSGPGATKSKSRTRRGKEQRVSSSDELCSESEEHLQVIAIDGPAASGKSTVARLLADRLGALLFDTGALYRAVTLAAIRAGVSAEDSEGLAHLARTSEITVRAPSLNDGRLYDVLLDGEDVTWALRSPEVGNVVSDVAAQAAVRTALLSKQRSIASCRPVVMVGRDIATVVVPDAGLKVYLDASPAERARRRFRETQSLGATETFEAVLEETIRRDTIDTSRETAPLRLAPDAVRIETDALPASSVADTIEALARNLRRPSGLPVWPARTRPQ